MAKNIFKVSLFFGYMMFMLIIMMMMVMFMLINLLVSRIILCCNVLTLISVYKLGSNLAKACSVMFCLCKKL